MSTIIKTFLMDDKGVTAIEYALIASLIAIVIIAAVKLVGTTLQNAFSSIATKL